MNKKIIFGMGCFWGVQKLFDELKGVKTEVGYAGGSYEKPTYNKVLDYEKSVGVVEDFKNHVEVIKIDYDSKKVESKNLLKIFWENHDPTQGHKQDNDIGSNYRSAIFYTNESQKKLALETKKVYQKILNKHKYGKITTEISELNKFYSAEEYHQKYLEKNPTGYCPIHKTGVKYVE